MSRTLTWIITFSIVISFSSCGSAAEPSDGEFRHVEGREKLNTILGGGGGGTL